VVSVRLSPQAPARALEEELQYRRYDAAVISTLRTSSHAGSAAIFPGGSRGGIPASGWSE